MKIACVSFTDRGDELGEKIVKSCKKEEVHHYKNSYIDGGIRKVLKNLVDSYDGIVFISATGIAVRMMLPYIKDKRYDPAVVVVDDMGRFSISLLSGHIGGANALAEDIAKVIGACPVITTASDGRGIESVDMFAKRMGYFIENMNDMKNITSMMVNGRKVAFCSEVEGVIEYDNLVVVDEEGIYRLEDDVEGLIYVTSTEKIDVDIPYCILRPKNLNIGIGCRRGKKGEKIIGAIYDVLEENNLSKRCIKAIGTIELKKDEEGIIQSADYFNCPMRIFTVDEIKRVEDRFEKSQFVKDTVGVYSVCEPCCYLLGGNVVVHKTKEDGITIGISKEDFHG